MGSGRARPGAHSVRPRNRVRKGHPAGARAVLLARAASGPRASGCSSGIRARSWFGGGGPPAGERDPETVGASLALAARGVEVLRVHDVALHARAYRSWIHVAEPSSTPRGGGGPPTRRPPACRSGEHRRSGPIIEPQPGDPHLSRHDHRRFRPRPTRPSSSATSSSCGTTARSCCAEIGVEGQERLWASRVLLVGLGGLGSPIAMYLAASGVGHLVLVDHDEVDLSNLQRQIVHTTASLGEPKVRSAARTLAAPQPRGPGGRARARPHRRDAPPTRSRPPTWWWRPPTTSRPAARSTGPASTRAARSSPARSSAWKARSRSTVSTARTGPCYECLHGAPTAPPGTCADSGVLGSVAGIIGTVQATEVVKTLLGIGEDLDGRVLVLDALRMEWQTVRLRRNPRCPACGDQR